MADLLGERHEMETHDERGEAAVFLLKYMLYNVKSPNQVYAPAEVV